MGKDLHNLPLVLRAQWTSFENYSTVSFVRCNAVVESGELLRKGNWKDGKRDDAFSDVIKEISNILTAEEYLVPYFTRIWFSNCLVEKQDWRSEAYK